jgi:hypothetical protein
MAEETPLPGPLWREISRAEDQHVTYQQLEAFVDRRLDETEAELVQAHADLCARCHAELQDLLAFATALAAKTERQPEKQSIGARIAAWFGAPRHSLALAAGAAAVLAVVLLLPRQKAGAPIGVSIATLRPAAEAVLDPGKAARGATFVENGRVYRVLTQEEHDAYEAALASAPDDPASRGAVAERFRLFDEAEKYYRQLLASDPAKGRTLLDGLAARRAGR